MKASLGEMMVIRQRKMHINRFNNGMNKKIRHIVIGKITQNLQAINFIDTHKHDDLTPELILELHKIVTDNTIDNPDDEGKFRRDDDINVVDNRTGK
jgi:Fic family protein